LRSHYFILDPSSITGDGSVSISGQDAKHISKVLRLRSGDLITISDGAGYSYQVELVQVAESKVLGRVIETLPFTVPEKKLTVFQGLPKGRKMELIVEKLTELGVARIVPVTLARSVPEYGDNRETKRLERWKAIAYEACKQSRRPWLPEIGEFLVWDAALAMLDGFDELLVPYEDSQGERLGDVFEGKGDLVAAFIGPEGGFEESEIASLGEQGAKTFSLGDNILRTETAAIVASALILDRMGV
jgi:16S rRNA (uracil1498-N3)-methyltransferase